MSPRPRNLKSALLLACLCALLAAGPARALKTDKNQPINVHSDHGDFQADPKNSSDGVGVYTGHVVITQGSIVINADKAVFHVVDNNLDTADITGNPATFVQQPDQGLPMHGQSLEITYDVPKNEIVLITHARLTQQVLNQAGPAKTAIAAPAARTVIDGIVVNDISVPGERLMTAERIRYNTDTQHVIAKSGDSAEQRVHVSFPPKVPASTTATAAKQALPPAAKNRAAPTVLMPRTASGTPIPAATSAQAPAAASHAGPP
jgi:lipopolysaccharide export system protein LptA